MALKNLITFNEAKRLTYDSFPQTAAYICIKETHLLDFDYSPGDAFQLMKWNKNTFNILNLQKQRSREISFDRMRPIFKFFKLAEDNFVVDSEGPHFQGKIYYNKMGEFHREDGPAYISGSGERHYYIEGEEVDKRSIDSKINIKRSIEKGNSFKELTIEILEELIQDLMDCVVQPNLRFKEYYILKFNSVANKAEYYSELSFLIKKLEIYGFDVDVSDNKIEIYPI